MSQTVLWESGITCFSHITQDTWRRYPCQRNQEISVSHTIAALIHNHIFLTFFRFFLILSYFFFTFSHLCTRRSTYLLATARSKQITRHITFTLTFIRTFTLFCSRRKLFFFLQNLTKIKQLQNKANIKQFICTFT